VKIANNSLPTELTTGPSRAKSGSDSRETSVDNRSSVEDSAEVSDIGRLAAKLQTSAAGRIEELRAQVRGGNYTADAGKVSGKLIDSMLTE
jgi:anti-sigma28 factor (negative regulator of flagellin synthesis)